MEKKYQVFISSTYEDLKEERQKVINALLHMNCFPVGMELFNASDDDQWTVIQDLIDECDYYILIIAGKYGSIDPDLEISYTQKEYEYALKKGVPTIAFVHEDPGKIENCKTEQNADGKKKLEDFLKSVKTKLCKFWTGSDDLAAKVVLSLTRLIKAKPRTGWLKSDNITTDKANKMLISLRRENDLLKERLKNTNIDAPLNLNLLKNGDDEFIIRTENGYDEETPQVTKTTWNEIFSSVGVILLKPTILDNIEEALQNHIQDKYPEDYYIGKIWEEDFQTIIIQLIALGLIETSNFVYDVPYTYAILTPYGKSELIKLKAIKKN